jgi:hypothetical protein
MQNQNWRFLSRVVAIATVTVLVLSFTTLAVAQRIGAEERNAIFAGAPRVSTSVKGVTAFAAPPEGFNFLTATNRELLTYGLPQRPDKTADAKAYEHWEKGMSALQACNQHAQQKGPSTSTSAQVCHATDVKALPYSSHAMVPAGPPAPANADGTTAYNSLNWSGIAQTNKNTKWNKNTSFDEVESVWNVPVANHPFGTVPCSDGPWLEVTWNGIDGWNSGDVVQGGSLSYWYGDGCKGAISYIGWVEWYPSYGILQLNCSGSACPVGPGDDFYVITYGTAGTAEQSVFVEDITQQWFVTIGLTWVSGPGLVGNSAEYIVERPCSTSPCTTGKDFSALGNYIYEFFEYSFAYDGRGTLFYPGSASASTAIITMLADDDATKISYPFFYGTAGNQGRYSIWIGDENCAYSGGCTP